MTWFPRQCVVVPIDFSEESFEALDVALQLVATPQQIRIVHVLQDIAPLEAGEVWGLPDPKIRIEHVTKALQERLSDVRYSGVQIDVVMGDPAHGISHHASEVHADLIVIPSHGRTGLTRLLMGSTSERTVRLAHCPVLVLRK